MNRDPDDPTLEKRQTLWLLTYSPLIWATHFLLSYLTAAIWIEKFAGRNSGLGPVRLAITIYTVIALAGIALTFWRGYLKHIHGDAELPHDHDTAADRHRFLGFATVLLSSLSAIATIYVAIVVIFLKTTH